MSKQLILLCSFLFLLGCTSKTATDTDTKGGEGKKEWSLVGSSDGSSPVERHEASFVKVKKKFYLLGGRGVRVVSIYDTVSKTWTKGTPPPIELHHFQPIVFEDVIYIVGALTGKWPNETPVPDIYTYNPEKNKWKIVDKIPKERRRGSTGNVLHNGKIYFSCGIKNGHIDGHKKWMDSYDIKTKTFKVLMDAPRERDHFQAVVQAGNIYLLAGRQTNTVPDHPFGGTIGEIDVYNVARDTWQTLSHPIPTQRAGNMAIKDKNEILVIGGESDSQEEAHKEVEALHVASGTWQARPALIEGRHGTGVIRYLKNLYIASGCGKRGGEPELKSMEKYSTD